MICFGGAVLAGGRLRISAENEDTVARALSLARTLFGAEGVIAPARGRIGKSTHSYSGVIENPEEAFSVLSGLFLLERRAVSFRVREEILPSPCCYRAFLRGAFLGGGSVTNPEKEYHLELTTPRMALAEDMVQLFAGFGLAAKVVRRKTNYVVYFKSSTEVGDVLNIIGSPTAYMELMNVRILKETRNQVNRRVNCETANLDKTLDAAQLQVSAIHRLQKNGKFSTLSPALREAAEMRLAYPDMPLSELGKRLHISKSGINHRMRKIMALAEDL